MKRITKIGVCFMLFASAYWTNAAEAAEVSSTPELPDSIAFNLYFRPNDDLLLREYKDNAWALTQIDSLLSRPDKYKVSAIQVTGPFSPDGNEVYNRALTRQRNRSMKGYLIWKYRHAVNQYRITPTLLPDFLPACLLAVKQDMNVPHRDKVLEILRSNAPAQTKWSHIRVLKGGAEHYIDREILPWVRNAVSCLIVYTQSPEPAAPQSEPSLPPVEPVVKNEPIPTPAVDTAQVVVETPAPVTVVPPTVEEPPVVEESPVVAEPLPRSFSPQAEERVPATTSPLPTTQSNAPIYKPLLALKTNLLFDALTALNLEIEVPIGNRWSVAAELIFPWWLDKSNQRCFQLFNANVEGRYWFGNRDKKRNGQPRAVATGWFAGFYAGGGLYDLEWETKGYQGEFFIAAGISGGYAHTINKKGNLRMEYSLGAGFMQTHYREYVPQQGGEVLMWQRDGRLSWLGPTRAKISLVWMLDYKTRKGGVK